MEIQIKITEKGLRYFIAAAFLTLIAVALYGFLTNALSAEGFRELQNFGPVK